MPATANDLPAKSLSLALQRLFYKLQHRNTIVTTIELTRSLDWHPDDVFIQNDVHEFNRKLCDKLEDEMKGTIVDGTIKKLFEGNLTTYVECINVDYKSTKKDSFQDLQLDVKGCDSVYSSLDRYIARERMEGENKYSAEHHGLQDAYKTVLFNNFPPILQLHLKRFAFDDLGTVFKINDRYEFPLELDLDRESRKYLVPPADGVRNLYSLHRYKFDDERVTKEDLKAALEEQYGGDETNSNAYMLVYVRKSEKDNIICNVEETDIAEHLRRAGVVKDR